MEKINLAGGYGRGLELAGGARVIARNRFFGVKKVYKEYGSKENKKKSQIKKFLKSFIHQHF